MNKLLLSFLKRFIIAPLIITAVVISAFGFFASREVALSQASVDFVTPSIDISDYNLVEYHSFDALKSDDYVATLSSDEIELGCAVCYSSGNEVDAVSMLKQSKEPWNGGSVAITGENLTLQLKPLHNSKVGTRVKIDYYKNQICTYEIKQVVYNNTLDDIPALMKKADLVLCVKYDNFESSNEGDSFYIAYLADIGGVEEWK